jgi:RNA polymerase sigma factor (sigma-70 family)
METWYAHSDSAAEELVQGIFLKIWLGREDLGSIENFQPYLFIMTRNQAFATLKCDAVRRKPHQDATAKIDPADPSTEYTLLEKDFGQLLEKAISRLPPQQQQVYRLIREKDLSRDEDRDRSME